MNEPPIIFFDENELSPSSQISLYTELIRLLEKEIDDARARNTQEGWTVFGMLGAIVGAGLLIFNQTKDLTAIPGQTSVIAALAIVAIQLVGLIYNLLSGNLFLTKENRLLSSEQYLSGRRFLFALRFFIQVVVCIVIYLSDLTPRAKWSVVLILIPASFLLLSALSVILSKQPVANNPKNRKAAIAVGVAVLSSYLAFIVIIGSQLPAPLGPNLTAAYIIGISVAALIVLTEMILSSAVPQSHVGALRSLKDDVLFRRADLNTALYRFQILREGKSVYDEVKVDYERILSYFQREHEIYDEQKDLVKRMRLQLPTSEDTDEKLLEKRDGAELLSKTFQLYQNEIVTYVSLLNEQIPAFYTRLAKACRATGDSDTQNNIFQVINYNIAELVKKETDILAMRAAFADEARLLEAARKNPPKEPSSQNDSPDTNK